MADFTNVQFAPVFSPLFDTKWRFICLYGGRASGKCLKKGTKVLMMDKSKKVVEDIRVGDVLLGPDGRPRHVLETHSGYGRLFKVEQSNACTYWVNEEHILALKDISTGAVVSIPIQEYLKMDAPYRSRFKGFKPNRVRQPAMQLNKDPLDYGEWLGVVGKPVEKNKVVPAEFLDNDVGVRLRLLAGIANTCGSMHATYCTLGFEDEKLAETIKLVADSLGFSTRIDIDAEDCERKYALRIFGDIWNMPFTSNTFDVPLYSDIKPRHWQLSDITVSEDKEGEWYGFGVDGDHLFMLDDCTVVHNSWSTARALLIRGMQQKMRILCCRELQASMADSVIKLLSDQIENMALHEFYTVYKNTIIGQNGTEFIFKGIRLNTAEIKSTENINICWCEEAQSISQESLDILIPTIRAEGSQLIFTWNPDLDTDPIMDFVHHPRPNECLIKCNYDSNPWFNETMREEMEYCRRTNIEAYEHIWLGYPRQASDAQIYKGKYMVDTFVAPPNAVFYHGVDWGFSSDPTVMIRCFINDNKLYIDKEAYKVGCTLDDTPALFDTIPTSRKWQIYADCARPETINFMSRRGFKIEGAPKWRGSIEDGIEVIKSFEKIIIHPECKHTIEEFKMYSYKVDAMTGDVLPVIVDSYNHCIAPGTLIDVEGRTNKIPIERVKAGMKVLTREGYKEVLKAGISDKNRWLVSVMACGKTLRCTPDHKIAMADGTWKEAGDLQEGDKIIMVNGKKRRSFFTATVQHVQPDTIAKAVYDITVYECHEFIADDFLVHNCIAEGELVTTKRGFIPIEHVVPGDIVLTRSGWQNVVRAWIAGIDKIVLRIITKNDSSVLCTPDHKVYIQGKDFTQAKDIKIGDKVVCHQKGTILDTYDDVVAVEEAGIAHHVYNLTVNGVHEFYAGGICVANCHDGLRYALCKYIQGKFGIHISKNIKNAMDKQRRLAEIQRSALTMNF